MNTNKHELLPEPRKTQNTQKKDVSISRLSRVSRSISYLITQNSAKPQEVTTNGH